MKLCEVIKRFRKVWYLLTIIYLDLYSYAFIVMLITFVLAMFGAWSNGKNFMYIWCPFVVLFCIGLVVLIIGWIHYIRWFFKKQVKHMKCHQCGEDVIAEMPALDNLDSIISVFPSTDYYIGKHLIKLQSQYPCLQYKCEKCGHEETICLSCGEVLGEKEKCPSCGKKIYTHVQIG